MTDDQREKSIYDLGLLMQGAMARYEASGCFSDRGQADGYRNVMERLIRERSAAQIQRMEAERGLHA